MARLVFVALAWVTKIALSSLLTIAFQNAVRVMIPKIHYFYFLNAESLYLWVFCHYILPIRLACDPIYYTEPTSWARCRLLMLCSVLPCCISCLRGNKQAPLSFTYRVPVLGGVHAAMVGSLHPTPVATLPFLSPHSAVVAFCEGILKHATAWEALREDATQTATMTLEQVRERMRSVLSLTDVTRFPVPKNPQAVIFVAATVSPKSYFNELSIYKSNNFLSLLTLFRKFVSKVLLDENRNRLVPLVTYSTVVISAFYFL